LHVTVGFLYASHQFNTTEQIINNEVISTWQKPIMQAIKYKQQIENNTVRQ